MDHIALSAGRREQISALLDILALSAPTEDGRPSHAVPAELAQSDYMCGLLDLLSVVGVVRQSAGVVEVVAVQAGWAIRLLQALLDLNAPVIADWNRCGVTLPSDLSTSLEAPDLLRALELRRQALAPGAAPLRQIDASVGLITRCASADTIETLLVYDQGAQAWQLPGGRHEITDATPEMTLLRELDEELGLSTLRERDALQLEPLPPVSETRMSPTYGLLSQVNFHIYRVRLDRPYVPTRPDVRWVSQVELMASLTAGGEKISAGPLHIQAARAGATLADVLCPSP